MKSRRKDDLIALIVVVIVIALDQLTKTWALASFVDQPRDIVGSLRFLVTHNTGAAFSLLSGKGIGPVIALVAVVIVVVVLRTMRFVQGRTAVIASGMIIGGALGNLADRAFRTNGAGFLQGAVVDWIDLQWWPVFNVADAAITTGAILLGVMAVFAPVDDEANETSTP